MTRFWTRFWTRFCRNSQIIGLLGAFALGVCLRYPFLGLAETPAPSTGVTPSETFPIVSPLHWQLEDVGCSFTHRGGNWESPPIFISSPEGNFMQINGNQVKLTEDTSAQGQSKYSQFTVGDLAIKLVYGRGKQNEGGASYPRAKLILQWHGQQKTIPISGGCGC